MKRKDDYHLIDMTSEIHKQAEVQAVVLGALILSVIFGTVVRLERTLEQGNSIQNKECVEKVQFPGATW